MIYGNIRFDVSGQYPYFTLTTTNKNLDKISGKAQIFLVTCPETKEKFFVKRSFSDKSSETTDDNSNKTSKTNLDISVLNPLKRFEEKFPDDTFINNLHRNLHFHKIDPKSPDVMELIIEYYENFEKEKFKNLYQKYQEIVNTNNYKIESATNSHLQIKEQNLKISDEQANVVRRMNTILDNLNLQQESKIFTEKKLQRGKKVREGANVKHRRQRQVGQESNIIASMLGDDNFSTTYPRAYENLKIQHNPLQNNEQNPPQNNEQNRSLLNKQDRTIISHCTNFNTDRRKDLRRILLENPYQKIWKNNFHPDDEAILHFLKNLQKTQILKNICKDIKFKVDFNYYKKVEFIEKNKDNIINCILDIPIPEDGSEYMFLIIDHANLRHKMERELEQKGIKLDVEEKIKVVEEKIKVYTEEKTRDITRAYESGLKIRFITVKQGRKFHIETTDKHTVITVPCKIGERIKKNAFQLCTDDDIDYQFTTRINFHATNNLSRDMDQDMSQGTNHYISKFTDNYNKYRKDIQRIQKSTGVGQSDSSDQNIGSSSRVQKPISSLQALKNKRLKMIRANPNDDLMCIIILCFLAEYDRINNHNNDNNDNNDNNENNPSINIRAKIISDDNYTDYKTGYREGELLKEYI